MLDGYQPLKSGWVVYGSENGYIIPNPRLLRTTVSVLEIGFVGQREVFVCLDFVWTFFFPLAAKLIGPRMGRQFFKNVDFSVTYPLNG